MRSSPMRHAKTQEPYSLIGAIQAQRLVKYAERRIEQAKRNGALQAILARLEAARAENAERYLADRLRRETSQDLS